jgi:hypothetical protein
MDDGQRKYYHDMMERGRGTMLLKDEHLIGIVTYFVGDDDDKYLKYHTPWTVVEDNPEGTTLYIDQFLTQKSVSTARYIHKEFTKLLNDLKKKFPNIKQAKWVRVGAQFRKHGKIEGVIHGRTIHNKNIAD